MFPLVIYSALLATTVPAGGCLFSTGMPRELNVMHAVLAMFASASSVHGSDCLIAACVFGGGWVRPANPKLTPLPRAWTPPSGTHFPFTSGVAFCQICIRDVPALRST